MPKRHSAEAVALPQARAELAADIAALVALLQRDELERLACDEVIARAQEVRDVQIAERKPEVDRLKKRIQRVVEARRDELLPAGRKSVELAGALLGFRTGQPKLKFSPDICEAEAVTKLFEEAEDDKSLLDYQRTTQVLAKDVIIAALTSDQTSPDRRAVLEGVLGLSVVQTERFFIEPVSSPDASATAADAAEAVRHG